MLQGHPPLPTPLQMQRDFGPLKNVSLGNKKSARNAVRSAVWQNCAVWRRVAAVRRRVAPCGRRAAPCGAVWPPCDAVWRRVAPCGTPCGAVLRHVGHAVQYGAVTNTNTNKQTNVPYTYGVVTNTNTNVPYAYGVVTNTTQIQTCPTRTE